MFRTVKMKARDAATEAEFVRQLATDIEKSGIAWTESIPKDRKDSVILSAFVPEYVDPIVSGLRLMADEYITSNADPEVGDKWRLPEAKLYPLIGKAKSYSRVVTDHPDWDENKIKKYLTNICAASYVVMERLGFHGEKERTSPFVLVGGGLWFETFDEPMLPLTHPNISVLYHESACPCIFRERIFAPCEGLLPILDCLDRYKRGTIGDIRDEIHKNLIKRLKNLREQAIKGELQDELTDNAIELLGKVTFFPN